MHTHKKTLSAMNNARSIPTAIQNIIKPIRRQHIKATLPIPCSLYYMVLFIVIFLEMLFNAKSYNILAFGCVGVVVAMAMLLLVGKSLFMLASMGCMLVICYIAYKWGGVHLD